MLPISPKNLVILFLCGGAFDFEISNNCPVFKSKKKYLMGISFVCLLRKKLSKPYLKLHHQLDNFY